jgi:predicted MFS family arabinose efflux permease
MMEGGETATGIDPSRLDVRNVSFRLTWSEMVLLLVLAAVQFTHIVDFVIIMPLGPRMKDGFGLSLDQFNYVVAAYAFSAAVAGLLAAFIMDRFNRKHLLFALYTGFVIGTGLCAVAPNYPMLLAARVVAGAFGGVGASLTLAIVGDAFPDSRRGTAMGILMSAFSLASIIGLPAGLEIARLFNQWQAPFAGLAALGAGVLVLIQLVLPSLPAGSRDGHPIGAVEVLTRFLTVLLRPGHLLAYAFMTALVMGTFTIVPSLATYLVKNVGMSGDYLELVYFFGGLATLLTQNLVGRLSDRLGKRPVFRVMAAFTVVPILLITNLPPGLSLWLALAATTLFMITTSGRMVPAMALITASSEPRFRGAFMSINSAVQQMAMALSAVVAGFMMGETESKTLTGYPTVGYVAAGVTLLTVFMVSLLRPAPRGEAAVVAVEASTSEAMTDAALSDEIRTVEATGIVRKQTAEAVRASAD